MEVQNLENINAMTDKMVMDYEFLAKFMNQNAKVNDVMKENGFELTGQFEDTFLEFISSIREETRILIQNKIKLIA